MFAPFLMLAVTLFLFNYLFCVDCFAICVPRLVFEGIPNGMTVTPSENSCLFAYNSTIASKLPKLFKNLNESGKYCIVVAVVDSRAQPSVKFLHPC